MLDFQQRQQSFCVGINYHKSETNNSILIKRTFIKRILNYLSNAVNEMLLKISVLIAFGDREIKLTILSFYTAEELNK